MTVSGSDVADVLGSTELTDDELGAFVDPAGRMYDSLTSDENVNAEVRDDVVTRLAAHLVATGPERQLSSAGEGGGNVSWGAELGEGLKASTHGQIALTLDPTGKLATSDKPAASVNVPDVKDTGPR